MVPTGTMALALVALLSSLSLGPLRVTCAAAVVKPRFMSEDQYESFYIDVHTWPDELKKVAIPGEKGKCNLLLQYLDLDGHLFLDDMSTEELNDYKSGNAAKPSGVAHAFPACNDVFPPAPDLDDEADKRLQVRDIDLRYGLNFIVLQDLTPSAECKACVESLNTTRWQLVMDKNDVPIYPPKWRDDLGSGTLMTPEYSYGPNHLGLDLRGSYPDPMTIALRQKPSTIQGLDMAKVHPGVDWKESFGVFAYAMPKK